MNADFVNRWLTLSANIGIVIGLILLIVELDQNRDMMRAQTRNVVAAETINLLTDIAYNDQYAAFNAAGTLVKNCLQMSNSNTDYALSRGFAFLKMFTISIGKDYLTNLNL